MKKYLFLTLFSLLAFSFSAFAQDEGRYGSSRLTNFANDLKRSAVDLADRTSDRIDRGNASRSEIEEAFLAAQLDASAGLFQQMIGGNNRASDLRDAASILNDLVRRAPNFGSNGSLWRSAQNSINDINRELGGGGNNGGGGGGGFEPGGNIVGRAYWRGTVDDRVRLVLQDRNLRVETISGMPYGEGNWSFTSSLGRNVVVDVNKTKGRGSVRVLQQPSRQNDFTAVVEIFDSGGGAKEYELEIYWRNR